MERQYGRLDVCGVKRIKNLKHEKAPQADVLRTCRRRMLRSSLDVSGWSTEGVPDYVRAL